MSQTITKITAKTRARFINHPKLKANKPSAHRITSMIAMSSNILNLIYLSLARHRDYGSKKHYSTTFDSLESVFVLDLGEICT